MVRQNGEEEREQEPAVSAQVVLHVRSGLDGIGYDARHIGGHTRWYSCSLQLGIGAGALWPCCLSWTVGEPERAENPDHEEHIQLDATGNAASLVRLATQMVAQSDVRLALL